MHFFGHAIFCLLQLQLNIYGVLYSDQPNDVFISILNKGNGFDTHRIYETMLLGSIPIIVNSTLWPLYKQFPIIVLPDWTTFDSFVNGNLYGGAEVKFPYFHCIWCTCICIIKIPYPSTYSSFGLSSGCGIFAFIYFWIVFGAFLRVINLSYHFLPPESSVTACLVYVSMPACMQRVLFFFYSVFIFILTSHRQRAYFFLKNCINKINTNAVYCLPLVGGEADAHR